MSVYIDEDGKAVSRSAEPHYATASPGPHPWPDDLAPLPDAVPGGLVEPSNAEQSEWPDATRDYIHGMETAIQSLTAERDAALARVAELEAGLFPIKRIADQTDNYPKGASAGVNVDRLRDARDLLGKDQAMITDAMKAEGWIEHDGGECPLPLIELTLRDGRTVKVSPALTVYWPHFYGEPYAADIIAYRPETKP